MSRLPDKSGWLMTASRIHTRNIRIWQVSANTGEAAPVTKDAQNYGQLSLDNEATKIVSTIIEPDFDARLLGLENPAASRTIADANSISFAPNGKIYFSSGMSDNEEIWSINADGGNRTKVTNKEGGYPLVAALADGQQIKTFPLADKKSLLLQMTWMRDGKNLAYITANRDYGNNILWLQSLDATQPPRQIAVLGDEEISGFGLAISPDGKTFGITQGEWLHDAVLLKVLR